MASLETGTIKLIKYIGSDKPTYLVDHNENMDTIDNEVAALRAADTALSAEIATKFTIPSGTAAQVLNGQGTPVDGLKFTDNKGAVNCIGQNIGTLNINSSKHFFTNCTGEINYSGTAEVFITNSPGLTINGKNIQNWHRIFRDGRAEHTVSLNLIKRVEELSLNTKFYSNTDLFLAADNATKITARCEYGRELYAYLTHVAELTRNANYTYEYLGFFDFVNGSGVSGDNRENYRTAVRFNILPDGLYAGLSAYSANTQDTFLMYEIQFIKEL